MQYNYELQVSVVNFDGEENTNPDIVAAAAAAAKAAEAAEAAARQANSGGNNNPQKPLEKLFNQDQVNAIVASDRRKLMERYQELESAYQTVLADSTLTKETREQYQAQLEDLQKTFLTKEETLLNEKKKIEETLSKEASTWKEAAIRWESQFKQTLVDRTLQDAAIQHEAFNPSQLIALLRPMTKVAEKVDDEGKQTYEVIVDLHDVNSETGASQITRRAPEDAVKRMKELKDLYGNLFKPNVVSGIGAGTAPGGATPGNVNQAKISTSEYMRIRRTQPEALGVRKGTGR